MNKLNSHFDFNHDCGLPPSVTHQSRPPVKRVEPLALFGLANSSMTLGLLGLACWGVSFVYSFSTFLDASVGKAAVIAVASVITLCRRINKGIQCFLFLTMCDW